MLFPTLCSVIRLAKACLLYDEFSAHELGKEGDYDVGSAGGYISRVAAMVGALDGRESIRLNVDTEAFYMHANDAAALGLLTSEILTNTLQHAFLGRSEGLVDVRLKALTNGLIRLEVDDDGVGLGASDWPNAGNLGAKIARRLVSQLGAELRVDTGQNGTSITVDVPYSLATVVDDAGERRIVENPDNSAPRLPGGPAWG